MSEFDKVVQQDSSYEELDKKGVGYPQPEPAPYSSPNLYLPIESNQPSFSPVIVQQPYTPSCEGVVNRRDRMIDKLRAKLRLRRSRRRDERSVLNRQDRDNEKHKARIEARRADIPRDEEDTKSTLNRTCTLI